MIGAALGHVAGLSARLCARLSVGPSGGLSGRRAAIARGVAIGLFAAAIVAAGARNVNFTADDRLHAARGGFVMEMLGGK